MELSGYAVAPLREGDVTRCRGLGNGLMPILLVTAADGSLASSERLEREYALKGGEPLDRLLGRPLVFTLPPYGQVAS
jgi:hypothetical protein